MMQLNVTKQFILKCTPSNFQSSSVRTNWSNPEGSTYWILWHSIRHLMCRTIHTRNTVIIVGLCVPLDFSRLTFNYVYYCTVCLFLHFDWMGIFLSSTQNSINSHWSIVKIHSNNRIWVLNTFNNYKYKFPDF